MHYTDAIAQLRALGFIASKFGRTLRITHRKTKTFDLRYQLDDNGNLPLAFDLWLTATRRQLIPKLQIKDLTPGTRVRHKSDPNGITWLITENFGERATGVATQDFTNPDEWEIAR